VNMRFRVDRIEPERITWSCVGHDHASWIGTTLDWRIRPDGDAVVVALTHAGWRDGAPAPVVDGWRYFLGSMKQYLETGAGQPW